MKRSVTHGSPGLSRVSASASVSAGEIPYRGSRIRPDPKDQSSWEAPERFRRHAHDEDRVPAEVAALARLMCGRTRDFVREQMLIRAQVQDRERAPLVLPPMRLSDFPGATAENFQAALGTVDMLFVIDVTGSMADYILAVQTQIGAIVEMFHQQHAGVTLRLGLIGYRDFKDSVRFEILDFTTNTELFRSVCASIVASGGDDFPEDLAGGLREAVRLSWMSVCRMMYLICDAPCHGREFCEPERASMDDFPDGCPFFLRPQDLLVELRDELLVDVNLLEISKHTNVMAAAFRAAYDCPERGYELSVTSLQPISADRAAAASAAASAAGAPPSYISAVGVPSSPPSSRASVRSPARADEDDADEDDAEDVEERRRPRARRRLVDPDHVPPAPDRSLTNAALRRVVGTSADRSYTRTAGRREPSKDIQL